MPEAEPISRSAIAFNNAGVNFLEHGYYAKAIDTFLCATRVLQHAVDPKVAIGDRHLSSMDVPPLVACEAHRKSGSKDISIRDLTSSFQAISSLHFDFHQLYAIRICDVRTMHYSNHTIQAAIIVINLGIAHLYAASQTKDIYHQRDHLGQSSAFFKISLKTLNQLSHEEEEIFLIRQLALYKMVALSGILFAFPTCEDANEQFDDLFELVEELNDHIESVYITECAAAA
ncbi:hypothetical protein FisN_28Hh060 [Fistulifera solaris]|uniref:Uncharacterized protein n=1 Tax=Fistulifera solaris TaxID=1519565 RepID=A0A1Z5KH50_FISSO|nr:hypothetical protein FisN_28Hh060 [Fistulifera solaris]|eukprot:GAX25589.1 hypothetical protein FisN_28Hh060 [Fistulifera solaris]